jgi:REP element-mobilizing transposase RayT
MHEIQSYRIPSTRLQRRNYDEGGAYFVTICVAQRRCVFGDITRGEVRHSRLGELVDQCWRDLPNHHDGIELDEFVVMPNHVHGILWLPHKGCRLNPPRANDFRSPAAGTLGSIVRSLKSAMTKNAHEHGYKFEWQPRYWDHVIRNNGALLSIREYIWQNPMNWGWDSLNALVAHLYQRDGSET